MKRNDIIIKFISDGISEESLAKFQKKFPDYYSVLYALYDLFTEVGIESEDILSCDSDDNDDNIIRVLFAGKRHCKALDKIGSSRKFGLKNKKYTFEIDSKGSAAEIEYTLEETKND